MNVSHLTCILLVSTLLLVIPLRLMNGGLAEPLLVIDAWLDF